MRKKRGLGTSLDTLLTYHTEQQIHNATVPETLQYLPIQQVRPGPYQPRHEPDAESLAELTQSIRSQGVIQPIIVRRTDHAQQPFAIIAGERRWRAAQLAGLQHIPAVIRVIADDAALAVALIENIQRENLSSIEEAIALKRLSSEFTLTHQQIADMVGKSRTAITNLLRLLNLPEVIQQWLHQGQLEVGHARGLITLPHDVQMQVAHTIMMRKLSVRDTETLIKKIIMREPSKPASSHNKEILNWQRDLTRYLNLKVRIHHQEQGHGKVVLHYRNQHELTQLLITLRKQEKVEGI